MRRRRGGVPDAEARDAVSSFHRIPNHVRNPRTPCGVSVKRAFLPAWRTQRRSGSGAPPRRPGRRRGGRGAQLQSRSLPSETARRSRRDVSTSTPSRASKRAPGGVSTKVPTRRLPACAGVPGLRSRSPRAARPGGRSRFRARAEPHPEACGTRAPGRAVGGGHSHQRLDRVAHARRGEAEVAVTALSFRGEQAAAEELRQVAARRLWRDAGPMGELLRRARPASPSKAVSMRRARRIAHEAATAAIGASIVRR